MKSQCTGELTSKAVLPIPSTVAGTGGQKGQESNWQYFRCLELQYFWSQAIDPGPQGIKSQLLEA